MKCPECGHDQKVKYGMRCGGCGYRFVFNPKEAMTRGITDGKFLNYVRIASQNDTTFFTQNQLYAVCCRRMSRSAFPAIVAGVVALGAAVGFAVVALWPLTVIATVIALACMIGALASHKKLTPIRFRELLRRWNGGGKTIDWLIEEPALHDPPPNWNEPDIYDYGVERMLIVERDILVDLFVKNSVHAEQRMLVISETGYPKYLDPVARKLLEEQPDLPVFLLHDATPNGTEMRLRVMTSGTLPLKGHPVTDLGMFPEDFQKLHRTKTFDPDNMHRALPVDAMMFPLMAMGLESAMLNDMTLGTMIEQQRQRSTSDAGSSFG